MLEPEQEQELETFDFRVQYNDNTYNIVVMTQDEWKIFTRNLAEGQLFCILEEMAIRLTDIKTIVKLPPLQEQPDKPEEPENKLGEWTWVDPDTAAWLRDQGIDLVGGGSE